MEKMVKLLILVTLSGMLAINADVVDDIMIVNNKNRDMRSYQRYMTRCHVVDTYCTGILTTDELRRLKAISKLKSTKSWVRLIESVDFSILNTRYHIDTSILSYVLCHSRSNYVRVLRASYTESIDTVNNK